ncbi:hypothetical protein SEPCBS57363_005961 [Sporothrix epigloea]|uniref:Mitogen-activated protein kinase organizer 1 n=1 Tax=Sporothrix epigloea TaxID=1892477 RepID=A0ABP0E2B6_9PEZI
MSFPDRPIAQLLGSNGPVHAVTYSAGSGTYILTGSSDRSIRLYNPQPATGTAGMTAKSNDHGFVTKAGHSTMSIPEGRLIQTYAEHGYEILSLACAGDNARFVSSGGDRTIFLWDVTTAQTLRRFGGGHAAGVSGRVNCVSFAGEGDSLVVSGGFDTLVRVWDTRSGGHGAGAKPIQTFADARDAITAIAVRGPEILAASVDGRVRTYDVRTGRFTTDVISGTAGVTSLSLTRDGRSVLVGALDSRLRLLDRENGTCLQTYTSQEQEGDIKRPVWQNEELRVQSLLGGRERFVVVGDEMMGSSSAKTEIEPLAPSKGATPDGRVWAWDLLTGREVATVIVPWGPPGAATNSRSIGRDGREKERRNVTSCLAWQDGGWGDHFCVGGTSGVVTVFGPR